MSTKENYCVFKCGKTDSNIVDCGAERIRTIIESSIRRKDGIHIELEQLLSTNESATVRCHKNCVSTYTSNTHIERYLRKHKINAELLHNAPQRKRVRSTDDRYFSFSEHCIFCGEICIMDIDSKNPTRWRKAYMCRTTDPLSGSKTFKEKVLAVCDARNDEEAERVRIRINGAISDLHAAGARYHNDCRMKFMAIRSINAAASGSVYDETEKDIAFDKVVQEMKANMSHMWTSIDISQLYVKNGGKILSRKALVQRLLDFFGANLLVLFCAGMANLIMFRAAAARILRLVPEEDDDGIAVKKVATLIKKESKERSPPKNEYKIKLDSGVIEECVSPTLQLLLSEIIGSNCSSLPEIMIGNIVTSIVSKRSTPLLVALGILVREKHVLEKLSKLNVTCTYDETLRFKESAAKSCRNELSCIKSYTEGLVQVVADNFDAAIASQNGIRSTHSLAMLVTQQQTENNSERKDTIRRIKKEEMKADKTPEIVVQRFNGPKKPAMPEHDLKRDVLPLRILSKQVVLLQRAHDLDFDFLRTVVETPNTPEYSGYNTALARDQGHTSKPETVAKYTPLIDMTPSDPVTMKTAMVEAQRLTKQAGQDITVFTLDQQLYKVAVNVMWVYPEQFSDFIPRLGGMHTLMSFVGSIGTLMSNSGLEEVMKSCFGGVETMLTGKKFPQNVRALRLVTEEILRNVLLSTSSYDELMAELELRSTQSRTTKLWVENLVKPMFIIMAFIRAEREAEWSLHLWAFEQMLPYFFAAGHINYARYGLYYLRSMQRIPKEILDRFDKGEHVMRHRQGIFNGIWSDQFIESTFMRYAKGPGGIIGVTLNPSTVKRWAMSMHICSKLLHDIDVISGNRTVTINKHKEEMPARINADDKDRKRVREVLSLCIDPLKPEEDQSQGIVNIASGLVCNNSVNVDSSVESGLSSMSKFEESWPAGFNNTLSTKVITMSTDKKKLVLGKNDVFDTDIVFSRFMVLAGSREIDKEKVFHHELSPVPTSMFDNNGNMRDSKTKSTLKNMIQVQHPNRAHSANQLPAVLLIDGCAVLWTVNYPSSGTVNDFVNCFANYIYLELRKKDVHLIFDRYQEFSIKSVTRTSRAGKQVSRKHKLTLNTPLPSQKVLLTVTFNKIQLIKLICEKLIANGGKNAGMHEHKLIIIGMDSVPVEIYKGITILRTDLRTTHEEADVIIPRQMVSCAAEGYKLVTIRSDDTDVFILLVHYYKHCTLTCTVLMEGTGSNRQAIDIGMTVQKHYEISSYLLAAHALSGCDTVSHLYGIGKPIVVRVLQRGVKLSTLGQMGADMHDIIDECTKFIASCYGSSINGSMSDIRYRMWLKKMGTGKKNNKTVKLCTLPPTTEAFAEHVKRAHFQVCIWKSALEENPPQQQAKEFGWIEDVANKSLIPVTVPSGVDLAPPEILKMVRCGCAKQDPCSNGRCSCVFSKLTCTPFCGCYDKEVCCNPWTKFVPTEPDDIVDDVSEEEINN